MLLTKMQQYTMIFCHFLNKKSHFGVFCNKKNKKRGTLYRMPRAIPDKAVYYFLRAFLTSLAIALSAEAFAASSFFCAAASAFSLPASLAAFTAS